MPQHPGGTTRLAVAVDAVRGTPGARLLEAVQKAVAGEFEILGELGRGDKGKVVYLARELPGAGLVALQVAPASPTPGDLWLDVLRKLDSSVPAVESRCPSCGKSLQGWGRFCGHCGADLAGLAAVLAGAGVVVVGNTGPAHLAAAVRTPVVSLFAPVVPAERWRPWGVPGTLLGDPSAVQPQGHAVVQAFSVEEAVGGEPGHRGASWK